MSFNLPKDIPEYVSRSLQLAILLEVSAYPKPGNVHRTADFDGTRYEHFLASSVAVAPNFRKAAKKGILVSKQKIGLSIVQVGKIIKDAVSNVAFWQHNGNTLLGSIILLTPIAVSAGKTFAEGKFSVHKFRANLKSVVQSTTPQDAVNVYNAIAIARPGGLGEAPKLDVTDAASKRRIIRDHVSLYEVFKISAPWDSISAEWTNNFQVTFDIGYPFLAQQLKEEKDVNSAIVFTFLKILSEIPDTLIARKAGLGKAKEVSAEAKLVLKTIGSAAVKDEPSLQQLDKKLRDPTHRLNPGTTADLTSAVLALATLNGYRP